ncbi:helix-turn-helix domain-containing protein [bacterium]|nr:helix-turn-helix domain-containing protein [bacterium]
MNLLQRMSPSDGQRLLVTAQEAAQRLCISERTLWGLTKAGAIPAVRIGRSVRYSVDDLASFIERQKGGAK